MASMTETYVRNAMRPALRRQFQIVALRIIAEGGGTAEIDRILAGGAGYFDQAHFGHEFRAFTGLTPTRYVEVRRR